MNLWEKGESLGDKLSPTDLNENKVKIILETLYIQENHKFSELVESLPMSRGTISKYLNQLKEDGLVSKEIEDDRSVNWHLTDEGRLYLMDKSVIEIDEGFKDKVHRVLEYIEENNLEEEFSHSNLVEMSKKFDFLNTENFSEPELSILKIFKGKNREDYEYTVVKKD